MNTIRQKHVLEDLIKTFGFKTGIEIGTLDGDTAGYLLRQIPDLHLTIIDPEPNLKVFDQNTSDFKDRYRLIQKTSDEAVKDLPGCRFDFVWIDGDHSEEQVTRDIINYIDLCTRVVGGHDYGVENYFPGVKRAVDKFFNNDVINIGDDFTWWVNL